MRMCVWSADGFSSDLTCVLALLFMAWMAAAWFIYHATLANVPGSTSSPGAFLSALFGTSQGWRMIVVGNLVGFGFALLTLAVSVVSFPMALNKLGIASCRERVCQYVLFPSVHV